jgi:hypothetical protein
MTHIAAVPGCRRYPTIRAGGGIWRFSLDHPALLLFLDIAGRQRDWIRQQFFSTQSVSHASTLANVSSSAAPNLSQNPFSGMDEEGLQRRGCQARRSRRLAGWSVAEEP